MFVPLMYRFRLVITLWIGLLYYTIQFSLPRQIKTLLSQPTGPRLHFHIYLSFVLVSLLFLNFYINLLWFRPLFMSVREISNEIVVQRIELKSKLFPITTTNTIFSQLPFYCQSRISAVFQFLFSISGVLLSLLLLRLYTSKEFEPIISSEKQEYQQIWKGLTTLLPMTIWYILPFSSFLDWIKIPIPSFHRYLLYIGIFLFFLFSFIYSSLTSTYSMIYNMISIK